MAQDEDALLASILTYFDRPSSNMSFKDVEAQGFTVNKYVPPAPKPEGEEGKKPAVPGPKKGKPKTAAPGKGTGKIGIPAPVKLPGAVKQPIKKIQPAPKPIQVTVPSKGIKTTGGIWQHLLKKRNPNDPI